jgi:hypothetical protein
VAFLFHIFDIKALKVASKNASYTAPVQIICEGNSEYAYIQELNRLLKRGEGAAFTAHTAGNGHFKIIRRKYKQVKDNQRHCNLIVWVDRDLYFRNENDCETNRLAAKDMTFYFSIMNFEDFLMLHQDSSRAKEWFEIMDSKKHWIDPLKDAEYMPEFRNFFHDYNKGEFPFELTKENLINLFQNTKKYSSADGCNTFADYLYREIEIDKKIIYRD